MDLSMNREASRAYTLGPQPQRFSRICVEGFNTMLSLEMLKTTLKNLFSHYCGSKNIVTIEITKLDTTWKGKKVDHLHRFAIVYLLGGEATKQKALQINGLEVPDVGKLYVTASGISSQKISELDGDNFVKPEEAHNSFEFEIMGYNPSLPRYEIKEALNELFKPFGEILNLRFEELEDVIYISVWGQENENLEEKVLALRGTDMGGGYKLDVYTTYDPIKAKAPLQKAPPWRVFICHIFEML